MKLYSFIRYLLQQSFEVRVIRDTTSSVRFEAVRKEFRATSSKESFNVIDSISLRSIATTFVNWISFNRPQPKPIVNNLNQLLEFFDSLTLQWIAGTFLLHSSRKYIASSEDEFDNICSQFPNLREDELYDALFSDSEKTEQLNKFFDHFQYVFSADKDLRNLSNLLFCLACYFPPNEFKAICHDLKNYLFEKIEYFDDLKSVIYDLPLEYINPVFDALAEKITQLELNKWWNLSKIIKKLPLGKLKTFCENLKKQHDLLPKELQAEKYKLMFGENISDFLTEIKEFESKKIIMIFDVYEETLYKCFGRDFYSWFIPYLWNIYLNKINREEILPVIMDIVPKVNYSINKLEYEGPPVLGDFKLEKDPHMELLPVFKNTQEYYEVLFSKNMPIQDELKTKEQKVMIVLAQVLEILQTPVLCVRILSGFEQILKEGWGKEFEGIAVQSINGAVKIKYLAGLAWKIPVNKPDFSKNSFLQKQCINFMQKRGFARNCIKMLKYIDDESFKKVIQAGDFFTESSNPYFLLHGKTIHNIGRIIIILAHELGMLSYKNEISVQDIFIALLNPQFKNNSGLLPWQLIFDTGRDARITFTVPFTMHALLMSACSESLPYLSALLTHSFAKGIFRMSHFFNWATQLNWTVEQVWDYYITPRVIFNPSNFKLSSEMDSEADLLIRYLKENNKFENRLEDNNHTTSSLLLVLYETRRFYPTDIQFMQRDQIPHKRLN